MLGESDRITELESALVKVTEERERLAIHRDTVFNVLKYVHFVLCGTNDVKSDMCDEIQNSADQLVTRLDILQKERDALKVEISERTESFQTVVNTCAAVIVERDALNTEVEQLGTRLEWMSDKWEADRAENVKLKSELKSVDMVLENRDALDSEPDRIAKILKAIATAKAVDPANQIAKLKAEVEQLSNLLRDHAASMLSHFQREHLEGDGPEIDRWKRKNEALKTEVEQLGGRLEWMSDHADEHRLKCQLLTNEIEKLKESKQRGG